MPQPLIRKKGDRISIGPMRLASDRPHLAALVAEIIGRWSDIEQRMGALVSRMFRDSSVAVMEMYLAIKNQRTQKSVIDRAAEAALSPDHRVLFAAIQALARTCEKERDPLAHRIFGIDEEDDDVLLLVDPAHILRSDAELLSDKISKISEIQVYREKELRQIIQRMDRVMHHIRRFRLMLDPENQKASSEYQSLCSEPDIAEVLARLRDKKSSP